MSKIFQGKTRKLHRVEKQGRIILLFPKILIEFQTCLCMDSRDNKHFLWQEIKWDSAFILPRAPPKFMPQLPELPYDIIDKILTIAKNLTYTAVIDQLKQLHDGKMFVQSKHISHLQRCMIFKNKQICFVFKITNHEAKHQFIAYIPFLYYCTWTWIPTSGEHLWQRWTSLLKH